MSILTYIKQDREHIIFKYSYNIYWNFPSQILPSHFINEKVELIISETREMKQVVQGYNNSRAFIIIYILNLFLSTTASSIATSEAKSVFQ